MVTIAPERDGALAAIGQIVDAGVVAAVGHTEATYEQTRAAIAAGATVGTHLFNAMRPIHHREPGPIIALLEDPRVTVELITDGVHVDPGAVSTCHAAARGRTGCRWSPTRWRRPGWPTARTSSGRWPSMSSTGSRGSRARTPSRAAPRRWTGCSGSPSPTADCPATRRCCCAVRQASVNPARALGLPDAGLWPGAAADLVVLDADLAVTGVLHHGSWAVDPA